MGAAAEIEETCRLDISWGGATLVAMYETNCAQNNGGEI